MLRIALEKILEKVVDIQIAYSPLMVILNFQTTWTELNEYLVKKLIDLHQGSKLIITTFKNSVLCSSDTDINTSQIGVHSCQSEEAD